MSIFKFKKFDIEQEGCAQKVGTDSMVLGAFVNHENPKRILDIGAGNGILSLMMAQKFNNAQITGVEIQNECVAVAELNFKNSPFSDRLNIIHADVNSFNETNQFDLIVSNPPFFENAMESLSERRTTARHQTTLKLVELLKIAEVNLIENGEFWLVVPEDGTENLILKSCDSGLKLLRRINVYGKPTLHKRDILVFIKTSVKLDVKEEVFTIRKSNGEYTDEYKSKTIDFHHSQL